MEEDFSMKKTYIQPEIEITNLSLCDILTASDDEVFVDGDDLFS